MPDNRIRLKQLYTPELSGFIVSVSSGAEGPSGDIGPTGISGSSITGPAGSTGPAGGTGAQGATGPAGNAGAGAAPSGTDGAFQYNNATAFAGTPQIFYDDTGHRIGLNTSSPSGKISFGTYSDPITGGHIVPSIMLYDDNTNAYRYGIGYGLGFIKQFVATGASSLGHSFGTLNSVHQYTEHMRITKNGQVGIQCIPSENFEVDSGNLKVKAGNVKVTGKVGINIDPSNYALDVRGSARINKGPDGSGYLGVGGVPTTNLHVFGDSLSTNNVIMDKTGVINSQKTNGKSAYLYVNADDDLVIKKSDMSHDGVLLDSAGNVGIKHSSPDFDLDMSGSLGLRVEHSIYKSKAQIEPDDANIRFYNRDGVAKGKITASGDSWLKGGEFGIGITPKYDLDVAGSGRFSESLSVNGTGYFGGDVTMSADLYIDSSAPATASAEGVKGTITFDSSYIYVCTATDTWKRVGIATW